MENLELRHRLAATLAEEERGVVDWAAVDRMLDRLHRDLNNTSLCPHFVWHFISDSDIRAKDSVYGDHQRLEVRRFVDIGDYEESKEVSPLGCLLVAASLGGLAFWMS